MTFIEKLTKIWEKNNSLVCVGLDPDIDKLPACLKEKDFPIFEFNKAIIDATADIVCSYKPQAAYYQGQNADVELKMTIDYINENYPEVPVILDVKRGDIGSTSEMYAREAFIRYNADAATLNPYMGTDTLKPFLDYADKGSVILCRTSNPSSCELQELIADDAEIYKHVAKLSNTKWNYNNNVMLVIGATFPGELKTVREICPEIPFLVPGVGAQGGDVEAVLKNGLDANGYGLVINSSRGIIYADSSENFAQGARNATIELNNLINSYR
ncbi:orotidine-5'-phosphate decarboxylase [Lentisphaerota bacterium WC36G]|nr:orotidine-5'-phosphate decarboxylase [Lentisphaerae bacterium WC36]